MAKVVLKYPAPSTSPLAPRPGVKTPVPSTNSGDTSKPSGLQLIGVSAEDERVINAICKSNPSLLPTHRFDDWVYPMHVSSVLLFWSANFEWEPDALKRAFDMLAEEVQKKP